MLAWHLGMRYLRKRRTAWLALAAITLTVAVPVLVLGIMQGFVDITRKQVRANESDLTIEPSFANGGLVDSTEMRHDLLAVPGVALLAPFVSTYSILTPTGSGGDSRQNLPCLVDAIDWQADSAMGRISPSVLHPAPVMDLHAPALRPDQRGTGFLTPTWRDHLVLTGLDLMAGAVGCPAPLPPRLRPHPGLVVGRELAYSYWLRPGQQVQLVVPNGTGGTTGRVLAEISDTIGTGVYEVDRYAGILPLPLGQRLADMQARGTRPSRLSGYRVSVVPDASLTGVQRLVRDESGERVSTWMERRGNLVKSMEIQRNIIGLVMIAIQVIAVFIVYAVFSTMVAEKRHDIGVLLGIGATRADIANAFLLAGLTACIVGGLLGWAFGWSLLLLINPFTKATGIALFPQDVLYTPEAPISWNPLIPLIFIGVMSLVGLLAVLLPARRASRIDPIDILRESG